MAHDESTVTGRTYSSGQPLTLTLTGGAAAVTYIAAITSSSVATRYAGR